MLKYMTNIITSSIDNFDCLQNKHEISAERQIMSLTTIYHYGYISNKRAKFLLTFHYHIYLYGYT